MKQTTKLMIGLFIERDPLMGDEPYFSRLKKLRESVVSRNFTNWIEIHIEPTSELTEIVSVISEIFNVKTLTVYKGGVMTPVKEGFLIEASNEKLNKFFSKSYEESHKSFSDIFN